MRAKLWPQRVRSVREDWFAWLPAEKDRVFEAAVSELEVDYSMLSVTLDEAFDHHGKGLPTRAQIEVGVSGELFDRLAARLVRALRALEDHARHFGTLPNVAPLNPDFFRGETAQRMARKSSLLQTVLFSARSKFFHKLRLVAETVEDLQGEFRQAVEGMSDGASLHRSAGWDALDILHYDLNTCLRETIVVLKSFLCALPNEEVQSFRQKLQADGKPPPMNFLAGVRDGSS